MKHDITHPEMVRLLAKSGAEILASLTPEKCHMWHMASCVAGEAGELFDPIKRHIFYGVELDIHSPKGIVKEAGDLLFYLQGLLDVCGVTLEQVLEANQDKLIGPEGRYRERVYKDAHAIARRDEAVENCHADGRCMTVGESLGQIRKGKTHPDTTPDDILKTALEAE